MNINSFRKIAFLSGTQTAVTFSRIVETLSSMGADSIAYSANAEGIVKLTFSRKAGGLVDAKRILQFRININVVDVYDELSRLCDKGELASHAKSEERANQVSLWCVQHLIESLCTCVVARVMTFEEAFCAFLQPHGDDQRTVYEMISGQEQ